MVAAVQAIHSAYSDPEYLRILQELMKLGIAPSGNKSIDKTKLEQAKAELIQKIQTRQEEEQKQNLQVQPLEATKDTQRAQLEELRPGATTIAELNRLYFVASPRHADGIVITGPISENMAYALEDCYKSTPDPKIVILAGACAISGGVFQNSSKLNREFLEKYPIDLYIPGCPVHPLTFINGVLDFITKK